MKVHPLQGPDYAPEHCSSAHTQLNYKQHSNWFNFLSKGQVDRYTQTDVVHISYSPERRIRRVTRSRSDSGKTIVLKNSHFATSIYVDTETERHTHRATNIRKHTQDSPICEQLCMSLSHMGEVYSQITMLFLCLQNQLWLNNPWLWNTLAQCG